MNKVIILFFISCCFVSCKKQQHENNDFAIIELEGKTFNFGSISSSDTIKHTFKVKNLSKVPFKINQVGTSCGCTTSNYTKKKVSNNEVAEITAIFIPQKDKKGKIKESVVLDCNVEKSFITLYLEGEIK